MVKTGGTLGMLLLGIVFVLMGIAMLQSHIKLGRRCTEPIKAIVIDHEKKMGRRGSMYFPIFRYIYGGEEQIVQSRLGTSIARYKIGEEVELRVDPNAPYDIFEVNSKGDYIICAAFIGMGILVGVLAFF